MVTENISRHVIRAIHSINESSYTKYSLVKMARI
jgi:hypothetical protein